MLRPQFLLTVLALSFTVGFVVGCSPTGGGSSGGGSSGGGSSGGGSSDGGSGGGLIFVESNDPDSPIAGFMEGSGGNVFAVLGEKDSQGSTTRVTGAYYEAADGSSWTVFLGDDGLPDRLVTGDWVFVFNNYAGDTVDLTVIAPGGTAEAVGGINLSSEFLALLQDAASAGETTRALTGEARPFAPAKGNLAKAKISFSKLLRIGNAALGLATCAISIGVSAGIIAGSAFLATPAGIALTIVGCSGAVISTINLFVDDEALSDSSSTISTVTCVAGGQCGGLITDIGIRILEDLETADDSDPTPDGDGDGVPDVSDACPNDPDKTNPGHCGCGQPDTDSDGDGIPDCVDPCPIDPGEYCSNLSPVGDAGDDQTVIDDGDGFKIVILNGSGSFDPDGVLVSYVWRENGEQIETGLTASVNLAVGSHTITLIVTDDDGAAASDAVVITVLPDTDPMPGDHLSIDEELWDDSLGANNDHNGVMEAGELVRVKLRLCSSTNVQTVDATLSTADPDIVITDDDVYYDDFGPGACPESVGWFNMNLDFDLNPGQTRTSAFTMSVTYKIDGAPYYEYLSFWESFYVVPPQTVEINYMSWQDEDDDSTTCPGQDMNGIPESGEFGAFNIHLENTGGVDIEDQGCEVRVTNSNLGNSIDSSWHDYPPIPVGAVVGAASPWHITGDRIPCTFTGWVTADVTIRCGVLVETLQGYELFEVFPPNGDGGGSDECEAPDACFGPICVDHISWQDEDDDSETCPGQEVDGIPESGEFGNFNIHLRNTSGSTIPDQGCRARVRNVNLPSSIREGFEDYPSIPPGQVREAATPWHLVGDRIPCTFTGCVTGDVTISCEGYGEQEFQGYPLFEVVPP